MEGELWMQLYRVMMQLTSGRRAKRQQYCDQVVLLVYLWAVLHDRPVSWACNESNWFGIYPWSDLPSSATMSRRLRSESMKPLSQELEECYRGRFGQSLCKWIDAMPLPIGNSSGDRQAGYGRAANGKAKGYKFYAIYDPCGAVDVWRVCPMNVSESKMAWRLVRDVAFEGYLVGDGAYDTAQLYQRAGGKGIQVIAPKRKGKHLGNRRQSPYRLRGIELQRCAFGQELMKDRAGIDRFFGTWNCWSAGIKHLPAWVRGLENVRRWVHMKLIVLYAWRQKKALTA